jgi:hypothetical protein
MSIRAWRGKPVWCCGSLGGSSHVLYRFFSKTGARALLVNLDVVGRSEAQTERVVPWAEEATFPRRGSAIPVVFLEADKITSYVNQAD